MTTDKISRLSEQISSDELAAFLDRSGAEYLGPWGKNLLRYSYMDRDILIPTRPGLRDYDLRIRDALRDLMAVSDVAPSEMRTLLRNPDYQIFRVRARPGSDITSLPFDEGIGLLESSKSLIRASAITALGNNYRPVIRGRAPVLAENYMDRVKIGQTDVGSYVFTLLLPLDQEEQPYEEVDVAGEIVRHSSVVEALVDGMKIAERMQETGRAPEAKLKASRHSANFFESLYEIVDWSDSVSLEIVDRHDSEDRILHASEFGPQSLAVFKKAASIINPEEPRDFVTITGTITRLSEPNLRRKGSLDLRTRIKKRVRSVRITFGFEDRETVIRAFKEKEKVALKVSGNLTVERSGRFRLESPREFKVSNQAPLI